MPGTVAEPFSDQPLATIALDPPPLVSVLSQVRFVPVFDAATEGQIGRFQRAVASRYPRADKEVEFSIALAGDPGKPPATVPKRLWRFTDLDGVWRVTLATDFVTLETRVYGGHEEFFARLAEVVGAVEECLAPPLVTRLGSRYIQRLDDPEDLARLGELIRPEVLGACAVPVRTAGVRLNLTTAQYALAGGVSMICRWGVVPPGFLLDVGSENPDRAAWLLDLDTFDERQAPFDVRSTVTRALEYSRRQYRFFRWAVEPAFLRRFGAREDLVRQALAEVERRGASAPRWLTETSATSTVDEADRPLAGRVEELKEVSGLTWEQTASALGVRRRTLHLWQRGGGIREEHDARLRAMRRLVGTLLDLDGGGAREQLLDQTHGSSLLSLLARGDDPSTLVVEAPWRAQSRDDIGRNVARLGQGEPLDENYAFLFTLDDAAIEGLLADAATLVVDRSRSRRDWQADIARIQDGASFDHAAGDDLAEEAAEDRDPVPLFSLEDLGLSMKVGAIAARDER